MRQQNIRLNRSYRLKEEVLSTSVQADGSPFTSPDVHIVRERFPAGRNTAWFYDERGNAYRASDFDGEVPTIEVEL